MIGPGSSLGTFKDQVGNCSMIFVRAMPRCVLNLPCCDVFQHGALDAICLLGVVATPNSIHNATLCSPAVAPLPKSAVLDHHLRLMRRPWHSVRRSAYARIRMPSVYMLSLQPLACRPLAWCLFMRLPTPQGPGVHQVLATPRTRLTTPACRIERELQACVGTPEGSIMPLAGATLSV
jgi:hypothetical protein